GTGELADARRATAIDEGLHRREDRTLQGRRGDDLAPAAILVGGVRGVVVAGGQFPDFLEQEAGHRARPDAEQQTHRLVRHLLQLAAHRRLPRTTRMMPTSATPAASTAA